MLPKRLLAIILFATLAAMHAGALRAQHLYLGARVGADLGTETDGVGSFEIGNGYYYGQHKIDPGASRFMELGFIGGFELDYRLSHFALSGSVLYDQKGVGLIYNYTTEASPTPIARDTDDITLNYLEIPLLVKWNPNATNAGLFLFAGPSFGFLLSGHHPIIRNESGNSKELFQSDPPSISAIAGLGFSVDLSSRATLFFDAAYAMGLTNDSFGQVGLGYSGEVLYSAKSQDIRVAAGILFPLN
ncbi:MAG TPA: porin family protein [Candidatus Kapabacteria bacterium]|nr:porin family protein [Candidatus Kapabacteria bacterium]